MEESYRLQAYSLRRQHDPREGFELNRTDANGNVTTYAYDKLHRLVSVTGADPDGAGVLVSPVVTYRYNLTDELIATTDPLNKATTYEYDRLGRRIKMTLPDPSGSAPTTDQPVYVTTYDAAGNIKTEVNARGFTTTYDYDHLYRLIKTTLPDPDGATVTLSSPISYIAYNAAGEVVSTTDPMNRVTTYEYNGLGQQTKVTQADPDGAGAGLAPWTVFTYDAMGNLLTQTDRLGNESGFVYDDLHRLTSQYDANGDFTDYTYYEDGSLETLTDASGNTTTWLRDGLGRVTEETNELADTRHFEYDANGNVVEKTDRNGRVTEYVYDDLNRLTSEVWLDSGTPVHTITWVYDVASRLKSVSDANSGYAYTYDFLGRARVVENTGTAGVPHVNLTFTFLTDNSRSSMVTIVGGSLDIREAYTYDNLSRLTTLEQRPIVNNTAAYKKALFAYNAASQLVGIERRESSSYLLASTETREYDLTGRLTRLHQYNSSKSFADYGYSYDAANRITDQTNAVAPAEDVSYDYDAASQLTGADRTGSGSDEGYTYDDTGNRTNTGYVTGDNNQLLEDGTFEYTYDGEGNRVSRTRISSASVDDYITEYTWDHRNRLVSVVHKDSSLDVTRQVDSTYDSSNLLIGREVYLNGSPTAAESQRFAYDGQQILLEFDFNGDLAKRNLWGPAVDQILASEEISSLTSAGDVSWMLTDHQNTVRDTINSSGAVLNHTAYDSFGNITSELAPTSSTFTINYTGKFFDRLTQLQYNWNRWYDPTVGRWISEDPIGFEASTTNLSGYAQNSPSMYVDVDGLKASVTIFYDEADAPRNFRRAKVQANLNKIFAPIEISLQGTTTNPRGLDLGRRNGTGTWLGTWTGPLCIYRGYIDFSPETRAGAVAITPRGNPISTIFLGSMEANITGANGFVRNAAPNSQTDIVFANIIAHEAMFLGLQSRVDDSGAGVHSQGSNTGSAHRLMKITPDELAALMKLLDY